MEHPLRRALLIAGLLVFPLGTTPIRATPSPSATSSPTAMQIDAACRPYFHDECSEATGEWLPTLGADNQWWDAATHVKRADSFVYERTRANASGFDAGPYDGTKFVYGSAGPPSGTVVYDRMHRIAFYQQGCCSWTEVVAATDVASPPKRTVSRDLDRLSTSRGIRLGQTARAVQDVYGKARFQPTKHVGVTVLAYTTWPAKKIGMTYDPVTHASICGQFENFYFRADRLILIQIGNGC